MNVRALTRSLGAVAVLLMVMLSGCTVPLGPGFQFSKRLVDVTGVVPVAPRIHLRVADTLKNAGNSELRFLDVRVPAGPSFGTTNLDVRVDGKRVESTLASSAPGSPLRIHFDSPFSPKQTRQITFEYDFDPEPSGRGVVASAGDTFYIADPNAFPRWQTPSAPFARGALRAIDEALELTVPSDFRVLSAGREQQRKRMENDTFHRFRTVQSDFPPYVVAGRFDERIVSTRNGSAVFWTLAPIDPQFAQAVAARLTQTVTTYRASFGRIASRSWPVRIVETPAMLAPVDDTESDLAATSFPEGVLFDHKTFQQGVANESSNGALLRLADYELARTWFGWHVRPAPQMEILLGRGIGLFAVVLAADARGGESARRAEIARLIAGYDRAHAGGEQTPILLPATGYTRNQRTAAAYSAALFFVELEDLAGKVKFERALQRVLRDMAGEEIGAEYLRAALEDATGRNLAEVFHAWLDHGGIPPDLRRRYAQPNVESHAAPSAAAGGAFSVSAQ